MVRETRHLWVGNLPDTIREDRIREHFKRYGRVQSVKLLPRSGGKEEASKMACTVAFMDIKSASKAHTADHKLDDRALTTEYYEPAAIPSSASSSPPAAPPGGYATTSPSSTRFPNGHSSSEEHATFADYVYERTNSARQTGGGDGSTGGGGGEYIRRPPSYHESARGRNRERSFRNGPQPAYKLEHGDRHRGAANSSWPYDGGAGRYSGSQPNEATGYSTTPTDTSSSTDRRSEAGGAKKKCGKSSASRSRTPSPSASTSSRTASRSRSRTSSSSTSSSRSSVSRATSSTTAGSPRTRRLLAGAGGGGSGNGGGGGGGGGGSATTAPTTTQTLVVHAEDRRPLAICVRNLPLRSSDTSLKDGLFHEYKKHGKVTWVKVVGVSAERHAIVCFKKPEDVEKAIEVSYDKLFFGCKIEVAPYHGHDVDDNDLRPYEAEIDEYHPKATRTLFIGNLEKDVTASDLRKHFDQFGDIIEIDIKKQGAASSYAFCQYSDIVSVVRAIRTMDGEHLNGNRVKLGFGKSMPTTCVWVDGVADSVTDKYLNVQFDPFGNVGHVFVDRDKGQALVFFEQVMNAQAAVNKTRGISMRGRRIQVDFASRECQEAFFENLEKQGLVVERPGFDERRDVMRSFDSLASARFSRYETASRPRTASYSGRTGSAGGGGQCQGSAVPSPGTPGSATPRASGGSSSRTRASRYEYYEPAGRNYDEYSQGSGASHEDGYEHEYAYHEKSPAAHADAGDGRAASSGEPAAPFAAPDIRNLQKERVHLLEQLEDCHSSGDELVSPRKRLKLEHQDAPGGGGGDAVVVVVEHRKAGEASRRASDTSATCGKHLSRRPSVDGGKHAPAYLPHAVCKRRKTAGSDGGRGGGHHYESAESASASGSRPGTPLCDERPEHFAPAEPRRAPRDRDGPLSLPLPRFAAQLVGRASVSVAGVKGSSALASPPAAATSPRVSVAKPPSPAAVPPPASPPPRPASLCSNGGGGGSAGGSSSAGGGDSSDGGASPSPSPSIEERIRSLDEKYEKWSGSRAMSAAAGLDALAKLETSSQRFRLSRNLLDLDLREVQPSEIVKSVMAKRSVFDEDSKRLENVGEKYEPKEFSAVARAPPPPLPAPAPPPPPPPAPVQATVPATAPSPLPLPKAAAATTATSTCAAAAAVGTAAGAPPLTPAKGLQYPFPSHPPAATPSPAAAPAAAAHRLKPCDAAWTSSKVNRSVNCTPVPVVTTPATTVATTTTTTTTTLAGRNIPSSDHECASTTTTTTSAVVVATTTTTTSKTPMCARMPSNGARRDSTTGSGDAKSSRIGASENCDSGAEVARAECESAERDEVERERRDQEERERRERRERDERERDRAKHKEDNHNNKKNEHRHSGRESHSEPKHSRENNVKDALDKKENHISKARYASERDGERRRDAGKEHHDKVKALFNDVRDGKERPPVEVHHAAAAVDAVVVSDLNKDPSRRKERVNSLPASLGSGKRRVSAHDALLDGVDETKKIKMEHRPKIAERRDSKDGSAKKHAKNASASSAKLYDDKQRHNHVKEPASGKGERERERDRDERPKSRRFKLEPKAKPKSREKESLSTPKSPTKELDKEFLARLELVEVEKQKQQQQQQQQQRKGDERKSEGRGDEARVKREKEYRCGRDGEGGRCGEPALKDAFRQVKEEKTIRRIRSNPTNSSDNSDSDEPKKHSIFDIVDDEPAYISMYDKVKARSCKNMQKQEEEKRQEKIKAKFSQLKQSRAKREEKKRSTSWDEDSESDVEKAELCRRKIKMLIASSDDDGGGGGFNKQQQQVKKEFSDSDSDRHRQAKSMAGSSDEEQEAKSGAKMAGKSRIASDTSGDERKAPTKVKSEAFTDTEDQGYADGEERYAKKIDFEERYVKKERKNSKLYNHVFDMEEESPPPPPPPPLESKEVKFNSRSRAYDSSAEEESAKMEALRKKHKKKQKRSKNSTSGEESGKMDGDAHDGGRQGEKRSKPHGKKEKKRVRAKDERAKKAKRSRADGKEFRRDGKMENIFGSLSDDSDAPMGRQADEKLLFAPHYGDNNNDAPTAHSFASDSDGEPKQLEHVDKERAGRPDEKDARFLKEEHRRRKERKRREKRMRDEHQQQQMATDNSVDYADLGKQLEDNIKDDSDAGGELKIKAELDASRPEADDGGRFGDADDKAERREAKEKKKKRKKSKDEKQRHHHHHHHHHDKGKPKTPEIKKEQQQQQQMLGLDVAVKSEFGEATSPSATPGSIFDPPGVDVAPSKTEKCRDAFIPGFGADIDEKLHENANAVKSISELDVAAMGESLPVPATAVDAVIVDAAGDATPLEEKPTRVVISQEETEDAVAALLGESFGSGGQFDDYEPQSPSALEPAGAETQDDEEMLQAVQSLNSSELEMKPETPLSEHDLQIDTDTEEQEDVAVRYDAPKTPEMMDYTQPPKTPDMPSYFRKEATISSTTPPPPQPPALTSIKPTTAATVAEVKRKLDAIQEAQKTAASSTVPVITVAANTWSGGESKPEAKAMPPLAIPVAAILPPTKKEEASTPPPPTPPPPLKPVSKLPVTTHNMPAQLPAYPVGKDIKPTGRLTITPLVIAKPSPVTTQMLPQPKVAQSDMLPQYAQFQTATAQQRAAILQRPATSFVRPPYLPNVFEKVAGAVGLSAEPPKLAALTSPVMAARPGWPATPDVPKLISTVVPTAVSSPLPVPASPLPAIVISPAPASVPFMPVIQEAAEVSPVLSSSPSRAPLPPPAVAAIAEHEADEGKSLSTEFLRAKEAPVTAALSPVIVAPAVVQAEEQVTVVSKLPPQLQEQAKPLAIEAVTEELNLTLKKADDEQLPEKVALALKIVNDAREVGADEVASKSVIKEVHPVEEKPLKTEETQQPVTEHTDGHPDAGEHSATKATVKEEVNQDADYWPASIATDSVIKKVDGVAPAEGAPVAIKEEDGEEKVVALADDKPAGEEKEEEAVEEARCEGHDHDVAARGKRGGRARGKGRGCAARGGMQTRRGKVVAAPAGRGRGRGGRAKNERKAAKSESDDVYEFRDDSDESKDRPRLIMTIKAAIAGANPNAQTMVKEELTPPVQQAPPVQGPMSQLAPPPKAASPLPVPAAANPPGGPIPASPAAPAPPTPAKDECKDEFASPLNTRKSRRLQERDVSRNTVDDTIEDVVKNTVLTRAAAAAAANSPRRSARQTAVGAKALAAQLDGSRKSARGAKKDKRDRRHSEATDDSSEEKAIKAEGVKPEDADASSKEAHAPLTLQHSPIVPLTLPPLAADAIKVEVREKPHEGLKAAMLRRVKGELQQQAQQQQQQKVQQAQHPPNSHESMSLIDPVTGHLTPMRECEEGRYIPLAGQKLKDGQGVIASQILVQLSGTQPPTVVVVKQKPQSLKARVLSQANAQQQQQHQQQLQPPAVQPPPMPQSPIQPAVAPSPNPGGTYPHGKPLNINVSLPYDIPAHLSPRPSGALQPLAKAMQGVKVIQPPLSPSIIHAKTQQQQQQQIIQQAAKLSQPLAKVNALVGAQMVHIKRSPPQIPKSPIIKHMPAHALGASPPLKQHLIGAGSGPQRIVGKTVMEPPKVDVSIASGCVMVPRTNASPQGRHLIPVPAYETAMQGDSRRRSPPPAHQNSPSPQADGLAHFTPGAVRIAHEIPAHYIHPSHVMYQQYMRPQPYHLSRSPMLGIEKPTDGQEGEEAPVTSPPLELRRPGSVGLALTGRANVPHSLQSPLQDRITDSPQVGQAHSVHPGRIQHQLNRFYDPAEPPPAHRQLTSHGSLAALGSERPPGHMGAFPDRPLSTHSALASHMSVSADRPLSTHTSDRSLSSFSADRMTGLGLGAMLGAAGNIMGAVARHVGDAPASQRGIQAATPPHASQVPAQAESLLMLLKQYPLMWQGMLALKNDQAAVQMYFVSGNDQVAKMSLPKNIDGSTPPLRIFQRMRLEPPQVEGVARKMQMEHEHCMLLALPCGHDHMDVLKQSTNLTNGFITYLQHKQAAGIVNVAAPGTTQPPAYVVHIFPSCDFVNDNLRRIAPSLLERVADIAHLLIVITTV